MARKKKAFTLIELLAVIAIIGILAGFIFAAVTKSIERAKITRAKGTIADLGIALQSYERDMGSFEAKIANDQMPTGVIVGSESGDASRIKIIRLLTGMGVQGTGDSAKFVIDRQVRDDQRWNGPYGDWKITELVPKTDRYRFKPGQVVDAWRNPLMIRIKRGNYDDRMNYKPDSFEIYSWGPNEKDESGKGDDITNWK